MITCRPLNLIQLLFVIHLPKHKQMQTNNMLMNFSTGLTSDQLCTHTNRRPQIQLLMIWHQFGMDL